MAEEDKDIEGEGNKKKKKMMSLFLRYWKGKGGWKSICKSYYLYLAIGLFLLTCHSWVDNSSWFESPLKLLPNLLGFGLAGYAIWIGYGDEKFREVLCNTRTEYGVSAYIAVSATFLHFAVIQIIALVFAIVAEALYFSVDASSCLGVFLVKNNLPVDYFSKFNNFGGAIGWFFYMYAILVVLETVITIFRLATWLDKRYQKKPNEQQGVVDKASTK